MFIASFLAKIEVESKQQGLGDVSPSPLNQQAAA